MIIKLAAIAGIVLIECYALKQGINGKFLALSAGLIGGIGGYSLGVL